MTAFLRFHDLTKSYYEGDVQRVVLQNAHAEFQPGEITAILGRSGSGKSTLSVISSMSAFMPLSAMLVRDQAWRVHRLSHTVFGSKIGVTLKTLREFIGCRPLRMKSSWT